MSLYDEYKDSEGTEDDKAGKITIKPKGAKGKVGNDPFRFEGPGVNFKAKIIGIEDVPEARGDRMCQDAMSKLKAIVRVRGEHKQRIFVNVSLEGVKILEERTGSIRHHHAVHKISFISRDLTDNRAFGYVYGSGDGKHQFFAIKTQQAAEGLVLSLRDLFQVVFEMKKKEVENAKNKEPEKEGEKKEEGEETKKEEEKKAEEPTETKAPETQEPSNQTGNLLGLEDQLFSLSQGIQQMDAFAQQPASTAAPAAQAAPAVSADPWGTGGTQQPAQPATAGFATSFDSPPAQNDPFVVNQAATSTPAPTAQAPAQNLFASDPFAPPSTQAPAVAPPPTVAPPPAVAQPPAASTAGNFDAFSAAFSSQAPAANTDKFAAFANPASTQASAFGGQPASGDLAGLSMAPPAQPPPQQAAFGQPASFGAFGGSGGFGAAPPAAASPFGGDAFGGPPIPQRPGAAPAPTNPFGQVDSPLQPQAMPNQLAPAVPARADPLASLNLFGEKKEKSEFFKPPPSKKLSELGPAQPAPPLPGDPFSLEPATVSDSLNSDASFPAFESSQDPFDTSSISLKPKQGPFDTTTLLPSKAASQVGSGTEIGSPDSLTDVPSLPSPIAPPPPLPRQGTIELLDEAPAPPPRPRDHSLPRRQATVDFPSGPPPPPPSRPIRQQTIDIPMIPPRPIRQNTQDFSDGEPPPLPPRPSSAADQLLRRNSKEHSDIGSPAHLSRQISDQTPPIPTPRPTPEGASSPGVARPRPRPEGSVTPPVRQNRELKLKRVTAPPRTNPETSPIARARPRPRVRTSTNSSLDSLGSPKILPQKKMTLAFNTTQETQTDNISDIYAQTTAEHLSWMSSQKSQDHSDSSAGCPSTECSPAVLRRTNGAPERNLSMLSDRQSDSSSFDSRSHSELNFSENPSDISSFTRENKSETVPPASFTETIQPSSAVDDPFTSDPFSFESPSKADPFTSPDDPFGNNQQSGEHCFRTKAVVSTPDPFGSDPFEESQSKPSPRSVSSLSAQDSKVAMFSDSKVNSFSVDSNASTRKGTDKYDPFRTTDSGNKKTQLSSDSFSTKTDTSFTSKTSTQVTAKANFFSTSTPSANVDVFSAHSTSSKFDIFSPKAGGLPAFPSSKDADPFASLVDSSITGKPVSGDDPFTNSNIEHDNLSTCTAHDKPSESAWQSNGPTADSTASANFSDDSFFNKSFESFDFQGKQPVTIATKVNGQNIETQAQVDLKYAPGEDSEC